MNSVKYRLRLHVCLARGGGEAVGGPEAVAGEQRVPGLGQLARPGRRAEGGPELVSRLQPEVRPGRGCGLWLW